ncbi:hypothetical protein AB3S75_022505 [Citrus x aurantiifolia]
MSVSTVASTGEVEGSVVVGKLLEQDGSNFGHDATKDAHVDMIKEEILDPLKVKKKKKKVFVGATSMFLEKLCER